MVMATDAAAANALRLLAVMLVFLNVATVASARNISAILDAYPDYSIYNSYLTQTRVCDEINAHETVTCLVLPNAAMTALASKNSLAGIKNALRLLTLLDYFDPQKIHDLPSGSTLSTTLYQTTGNAAGNLGFVNITNLRGGRVGFASTSPGSKFDSTYTKSVKQAPFNLSIMEISAPIIFPGLLDAPSASTTNLTALLDKAGCKTFSALIASSGVLKVYESAMDKGLTLFAPNDDAFNSPGAPDLNTLSSADLVTLLQYHALPAYRPKASLASETGTLPTLASGASGKYDISVKSQGEDVSLDTGVDTSRVASTVLDDTPVCVVTVDSLLLPVELFGGAPAPAPGPFSPSPSPVGLPPAPASSESPLLSPPAPPTNAPSKAPRLSADDKAKKHESAAPASLAGLAVPAVVIFALLFMAL